MSLVLDALPTPTAQAERLVALGVHDVAGLSPTELRDAAAGAGDALLAVSPELAPVSALAPLLRYRGRPGSVVPDTTDVDDFGPRDGVPVLDGPARGAHAAHPRRGRALAAPVSRRPGTEPVLHDHRVAAAPAQRRPRRPHPGAVDQQRDRPRRS